MYWIDVLGNISTMATVFAVICGIIIAAMFVLLPMAYANDDEDIVNALKKGVKKVGVCLILSTVVAVFTPSEKSMYMIYGVGGTIDYLKENETAKQLPDKVVMALDKWVDSQVEDKNKEDKDN